MSSFSTRLFTRDRLPEFLSLRQATTAGCMPAAPKPNGDVGSGGGTPPWIRALQHFTELEATVTQKIERLREQQHVFLQPKFLSDEEEDAQQRAIDAGTQAVQKLLRELERMVVAGMRPQDPANEDEVKAVENAKKHLSSRMSMIIQSFRDGQELYAAERRRREEKARRYQKFGSSEAHREMEREERIAQYLELGYTQSDIQELLEEDEKQKEISREVQEILENVTELQTMVNDLAAMVLEQGTVLDRIDFNVQQTQQDVRRGLAELKKAQEKQSGCWIM